MQASHRTEGSGDEETLRQEVVAVIVGRIALITLVSAMAACFSERAADPTQHLPLVFLVALSGGLAYSYHRAAVGGAPLRPLLATQLMVDVAVVSYLLLFTGGASSPFAPLYLLTRLVGGFPGPDGGRRGRDAPGQFVRADGAPERVGAPASRDSVRAAPLARR